jgi:ATP-dependent Lon protease
MVTTRNLKRKRFNENYSDDELDQPSKIFKRKKKNNDTPSQYNTDDDVDEDVDEEWESDESYEDLNDKTLGGFIVPDTFIDHSIKSRRNINDKINSEFKDDIKLLMKEYDDKKVSVVDIVKSKLSSEKKLDCFEKLIIMNNELRSCGPTDYYHNLKNSIFKTLNEYAPFTQSDEKELTRLLTHKNNKMSLEQEIIRSNHSDDIKLKMYEQYKYMNDLRNDDESKSKYTEWIRTCLELPTELIKLHDIYRSCDHLIINVKKKLDMKLFGQNQVKEKILEILAMMWTNPLSNNKCVVFKGNPGVGKTALARILADSIGLPFYQISLGGAKDVSLLKGHGITYISSKPGEFVNALRQMKHKNGILFLDELDKITGDNASSGNGMEVLNCLLHVLDYTQNNDFKDNYLHGIPIDLSNLVIILSINDLNCINNILRDRLPIVEFSDYDKKEKVEIGYNYLIPRVAKNVGVDLKKIKFDKSSVACIIEKSNIIESGVRQLERNITTIFQRLNLLLNVNKKTHNKINLSYNVPKLKIPINLNRTLIDSLFEENVP